MSVLQGNQGQSGKAVGQNLTAGFGEFSDLLVTELMGRFYQNTLRGLKFTCSTAGGGVALAATHLFSTAIATFTPILAIYNPLTSPVNLVVLSAWCGLHSGAATQGTTGAFLFVVNAGQTITNAQSATPVNNKTLKALGSQAFGITNAVLAGAVGNPVVLRPFQSLIQSGVVTSQTSGLAVIPLEPVDGSIIVPPGGYLAMATGVSIATGNAVAGITWDEVLV